MWNSSMNRTVDIAEVMLRWCNGSETFPMSRLNVHLDTEVFDAAKLNLTGNRFTKLQEHCEAGRARLLITTVTRREIGQHVRELVRSTVTALKKASVEWSFLRNIPTHNLHALVEKPDKKDLEDSMMAAFDAYLRRAQADTIDLANADAENIFDSYFNLKPPFSEGNKKSEFPDAFAIQALERWCENHDEMVYAVSGDRDWRNACASSKRLIHLASLDSFLDLVTQQQQALHEKVRELYATSMAKIIDAIKLDFSNRGFYVQGEQGEVEDLKVWEVTLLDNVAVLAIGEVEAAIGVSADVEYTARITVDDTYNGAYDKEEGCWMVLPTRTGIVSRVEEVSVEITLYLSEDYSEVVEVACDVDADGAIELDYSEWQDWPTDLDIAPDVEDIDVSPSAAE
jgi:hypothetical protein